MNSNACRTDDYHSQACTGSRPCCWSADAAGNGGCRRAAGSGGAISTNEYCANIPYGTHSRGAARKSSTIEIRLVSSKVLSKIGLESFVRLINILQSIR